MASSQPLKHLGQMIEEYLDHYNATIREPDAQKMNWNRIGKAAGLSSGHMANIHNNISSRKGQKTSAFKAMPLETVDKVLHGISTYPGAQADALRPWFRSASNVDNTPEVKAQQPEIEQLLRQNGILPETPASRRAIKSQALVRKQRQEVIEQGGRRRRGAPPLTAAQPILPATSGHFAQGLITIRVGDISIESESARMHVGQISIEGTDMQAALSLLLTIGGNKQ